MGTGTWLSPREAAKYIKESNPITKIGESSIRRLLKEGFPCIKIGTRQLIDMDTFKENLLIHNAEKETH